MDALTNCARKDPYESEEEARAALALWRWRAANGYCSKIVGRPHPYKCKACHRWHLGRQGGVTQHGRRQRKQRRGRR